MTSGSSTHGAPGSIWHSSHVAVMAGLGSSGSAARVETHEAAAAASVDLSLHGDRDAAAVRPERGRAPLAGDVGAEGLYAADPDDPRPPFVDAHPPPNVTGELHMGHAQLLSLGDAVVRMKRMQGFNVLFQPGYDHAGISTQNAVEKHLAKEGTTRQEFGREAFEARVWEWLPNTAARS